MAVVHLFYTVVHVGIGQNWGDCNRLIQLDRDCPRQRVCDRHPVRRSPLATSPSRAPTSRFPASRNPPVALRLRLLPFPISTLHCCVTVRTRPLVSVPVSDIATSFVCHCAPPPGSHATPHTVDVWADSTPVAYQSSSSSAHTRTVSSYEADARSSACGCHASALTSAVWAVRTATHSTSSGAVPPTSQIQTDLSREAVARRAPPDDQATDLTCETNVGHGRQGDTEASRKGGVHANAEKTSDGRRRAKAGHTRTKRQRLPHAAKWYRLEHGSSTSGVLRVHRHQQDAIGRDRTARSNKPTSSTIEPRHVPRSRGLPKRPRRSA